MFNHDLPSNPYVEKQREEVISAINEAIDSGKPYITIMGRPHSSILTMLKRGNYPVFDGWEKDSGKDCIYIELVPGSSEGAE